MNLRKMISLAVLLLATAVASAADKWTDVTRRFMTNPAFDSNSSEGWTWESNATTQEVRVNCISFFNGYFTLKQQLKGLPKGRYRLSVQGFYRMGEVSGSFNRHQDGSEKLDASLYAGGTSKQLVSIFSASLTTNAANRCWTNDNQHYYPDGKEAALAAFDEGYYWNAVEFSAEGDIEIGVKCSTYEDNNYCVLDNFRLEYAGGGDADGKAWIDLTGQLLQNPGFNNGDNSGWTWESNAESDKARCESMEFWNGTFDIHQTLRDLPKGK